MERKPDVDLRAVSALLRHVLRGSPTFERTADGVSTQVYRVFRGTDTFYLRIAEEAHEDLSTDAALHQRLLDLGVSVARVVHVEPFDAAIGRSVMITTEVRGASLAEVTDPAEAVTVVEAAGHDVALINSVPVNGFGFVQRSGSGWPLRAEHAGYEGFLTSHLEGWPGALSPLFTREEVAVVDALLVEARSRPPTQATLAHGDFDVTQIFCARGRYTGLIDFGEIRGAEPLFDLAHFLLHERETLPGALLPALLRGYRRVRRLPDDHADSIRRSAVLLGLRQLSRWLGPLRRLALDHPAVVYRSRRLKELIALR